MQRLLKKVLALAAILPVLGNAFKFLRRLRLL